MATETDTSGTWSSETLRQYFATIINDNKAHSETRLTELEQRIFATIEANDSRYKERWEAVQAAIAGARAILETRLEGMDRAGTILAENVNRVPTVLDREIARLTVLTDEKFVGVQRQFADKAQLANAAETAAATAVAAALQAQKEAASAQNQANAASITKSEVATNKQIADLQSLIAAKTSALDDKLVTATDRLTRIEGNMTGTASRRTEGRLDLGTVLGAISLVVVVLGGVLALVAYAHPPQAASADAAR